MKDKACVLIHGFTGSPEELEIIAEHLKAKGIITVSPTLPGHGPHIERKALKKVTYRDWIDISEQAVKEMTDKHQEVYLVGFSMGGLISAYLATKYPIKKLILISASLFYTSPQGFIRDLWQKPLTRPQIKRYYHKITGTPLKAALNFRRLVKDLDQYIGKINIPTLIIQGEKDDLVDPKSAKYIYDTIPIKDKYLHLLPNSKHIVCWDCESAKVIELVDSFFIDSEVTKH